MTEFNQLLNASPFHLQPDVGRNSTKVIHVIMQSVTHRLKNLLFIQHCCSFCLGFLDHIQDQKHMNDRSCESAADEKATTMVLIVFIVTFGLNACHVSSIP